jgi:hypothetical protein
MVALGGHWYLTNLPCSQTRRKVSWFWIELSRDQKQRLQRVIFPKGLTFRGGAYLDWLASPARVLLLVDF